jgi:DNA-binding LacI/PurR family transcriptional regulator
MKLNYKEISRICGIPIEELENKYQLWKEKGKRGNGTVDLKLISALSGVSVSSVSNYFNKKKGAISAEKSQMLDELVTYLDYIPSHAAKKLRSSNKMSIGYIAPISQSPSTEYYIEILKGIKKESVKYGYTIEIYDISVVDEKDFFSKLLFMGLVDGLIIVSSTVTAKDLAQLHLRNIPVFHINPKIEDKKPPFIGSVISEISAVTELFDHIFKDHSYRNPVLFSVNLNNYSQREEKYQLFIDAMEKNGMDFDEEKNVVFLNSYSISEGVRGYQLACEKNPDVDICVCLSDTIAIPILHIIGKENKKIAVTGYANFEIAEVFDLTTIDQNIESLGTKAFQQLYFAIKYIQLNKHFPDYTSEQIPVKLIKRKSCAC